MSTQLPSVAPLALGEDVLDEQTLKTVASITGGLNIFFVAHREQLDAVYQRLDALQSHKAQTKSYRPRRDVYDWPLASDSFLPFCTMA